MAVAVDRRNPGTPDSASSPTNSCGTSRVTVASYGDLCRALLQIENRIRWISLRKESLFWLQFNDPSTKSSASEECYEIERGGAAKVILRPPFSTTPPSKDAVGFRHGNRLQPCRSGFLMNHLRRLYRFIHRMSPMECKSLMKCVLIEPELPEVSTIEQIKSKQAASTGYQFANGKRSGAATGGKARTRVWKSIDAEL